jgi:hypothetical protein
MVLTSSAPDDDEVGLLARGERAGDREPPAPSRAVVDPQLLLLLDQWSNTPALMIDRALDVLAVNTLARQLYADFGRADNIARMTFGPGRADVLRRLADGRGRLRGQPPARPGPGPARSRPLGAPRRTHPRQRRVPLTVGPHDVRGKTREAKTFCHRDVGALTLTHHTFEVRASPGQQLVVYAAEPGSASADGLALLGALAATGNRTADH